MSPSKLVAAVAILVAAAGSAALAGTAEAQISGTIGGDVVAVGKQGTSDMRITPVGPHGVPAR